MLKSNGKVHFPFTLASLKAMPTFQLYAASGDHELPESERAKAQAMLAARTGKPYQDVGPIWQNPLTKERRVHG